MKIDINDIKQLFTKSRKKPRRNVVHTIGYSKFSPQEIARKTRSFITDERNKKVVRNVCSKAKSVVNNPKNKEVLSKLSNSVKDVFKKK